MLIWATVAGAQGKLNTGLLNLSISTWRTFILRFSFALRC